MLLFLLPLGYYSAPIKIQLGQAVCYRNELHRNINHLIIRLVTDRFEPVTFRENGPNSATLSPRPRAPFHAHLGEVHNRIRTRAPVHSWPSTLSAWLPPVGGYRIWVEWFEGLAVCSASLLYLYSAARKIIARRQKYLSPLQVTRQNYWRASNGQVSLVNNLDTVLAETSGR